MQTVSENWKNEHKRAILRESFVEVALEIADPERAGKADAYNNGTSYISGLDSLTDDVLEDPSPFCTLEQNLWVLDGNRIPIPEGSHYGHNGFVGDVLSDDDCMFSVKQPTIEVQCTEVFERLIPGITITWSETYGEFADSFTVIGYLNDQIIAVKDVFDNKSVTTQVFMDLQYYNRIEIIIHKWCLPNKRVRVENILLGIRKVYSKADLINYSHTQVADPISLSLPKYEIKFGIDNTNGDYNPYNTDGLSKYINERQEIKTRYGLKLADGTVEWIKGGTFYLSEWYAKQNGITAEFTARDKLEFLSATYNDEDYITNFDTISANSSDGRSLYSLAEAVLSSVNLPISSEGHPLWSIDDSLKRIFTKAPLPEDTCANCLQLIANAGRCCIRYDRNGTIRIEPFEVSGLSGIIDYDINLFNSFTKTEISLSKPIKSLRAKVYSYRKNADGEIESTSVERLIFDATQVSDGEIISLDNPLITSSNEAQIVGQWLGAYMRRHRMSVESSWRPDVSLDVLDVVRNQNEYTTNAVLMTEVEFTFNGAFRGKGKGKVR